MSKALICIGIILLLFTLFVFIQPGISGLSVFVPYEPMTAILGVVVVFIGVLLSMKRKEENDEG
ncbi:MAG: hypothetical protein QXP39_03165 [Candidatus Aenigmatarchaeota archaeon]